MEKFPIFDKPKVHPIIKNFKFLIDKWIRLEVSYEGRTVVFHNLAVENIEYLQRCNGFSYYLKIKGDPRLFVVDDWIIRDAVSFLTY